MTGVTKTGGGEASGPRQPVSGIQPKNSPEEITASRTARRRLMAATVNARSRERQIGASGAAETASIACAPAECYYFSESPGEAMALKFTKMHGLGNDYVYVSLFDQHVDDPAGLARAISDRHRGVGGDGLILLAPPDSAAADARMIIFNSDGSRAQMCGNGIRCLAKLAWERGLVRRNPMCITTDAGVMTVELMLDGVGHVNSVRVDMGPPILQPGRIPVRLAGERVVAAPLQVGARSLLVTCVSMGNPHAVFFAERLEDVPLADWGPRIERHALFPERTNVHFAQVLAHDRVRMITWERGAGLTQACGTGACAVTVAGVLNGLTDRALTAELPGGELQIEWWPSEPGRAEAGSAAASVSAASHGPAALGGTEYRSNHVFMTGPAEEVFTGEWPT
jgi:diaminopimelate epimerase